jgi:glycerol-3-phosphate dehydrogenase
MQLEDLPDKWDVIVIGGGVTGAGILREAVRMNVKALLVEQKDFAWGTSSRSSKLVHGGLRYLKEGHFLLTREAVRERERLLKDAPGLVEPLPFLVPVYKDRGPGKWALEAGLSLYDLIARKRQHNYFSTAEFFKFAPYIDQKDLLGGFRFYDAQVDDARLVLRLIDEACRFGGYALNYTRASTIHRDQDGQVRALTVEDTETHVVRTLETSLVINATGAWAERLHPSPDPDRHLRPLRGTHLLFPAQLLPVDQAISFVHPADNRAVFVIPWEGVVLVGTTDLDHETDLDIEPATTAEEVLYLMEGLKTLFPSFDLSTKDCISTIAGVRPVLSKGRLDPSEESREHMVWKDKGLITITGGKLTTFRKLALDTLKAAKPFLPQVKLPNDSDPVFNPVPELPDKTFGLSPTVWRRLFGRYGAMAQTLVGMSPPDLLKPIPGTQTLWAELPYAAKHEQVKHLSDLLLRRVRIGLLTRDSGKAYLKRIQKICRPYLPWDKKQWKSEIRQYLAQSRQAHGLPLSLRVTFTEQPRPSLADFKAFCAYYVRKIFASA